MVSQAIPSRFSAPARPAALIASPPVIAARLWTKVVGTLCLPFHQSLRRQGTNLDSGPFPRRPGARRFRGSLPPSVLGRAGSRLRGQRLAERDRRAPGDDAGLFGAARHAGDGLAWHERNPPTGLGGPGDPQRGEPDLRAFDRRSGFRRAGAQVSNLGAGPFPGASRRGQDSSAPIAGGARRQSGAERAGGARGMMASRGEAPPPAGGPARHIPALLDEAVAALGVHEGGVYCDGTFGAGGYARAILDRGGRVVAIDRDPDAIAAGQALAASAGGRLALVEGRFGELDAIARSQGFSALDGVVLDIGVSSMQLDEAQRGFSFRNDAPLDMRMGRSGRSAADPLADILYHFGEERAARRIARAIVHDREAAAFVSTRQLASLIERVAPARPGEAIHPATRSFQALRIAVNDELGELARGLVAAEAILKPGGRLAVVTFHSLEDRVVKQFLARRSGRGETAGRRLPGEKPPPAPTFSVEGGQPIVPSEAERVANPRARSAKLRFATRSAAPARGKDDRLIELVAIPPRRRS